MRAFFYFSLLIIYTFSIRSTAAAERDIYSYGRLPPSELRAEVRRLFRDPKDAGQALAADIMAFYPAFLDTEIITEVLPPLLKANSKSVVVSAIDAAGEIALLGFVGDVADPSVLHPIKPSVLRSLLSSVGTLRRHSDHDIAAQASRVYRDIRFRLKHPAKADIKA